MERLRCAAIGLGRLGYRHATNLAGSIPQSDLVAVSDVSQATLDAFSVSYPEVQQHLNYQDILKRDDIDAVVIASSTSSHGQVLRDTILSGKPAFLEKPLSMDWYEAVELERLAMEKKAFVQLGFMRRFDRSYVEAKEQIVSGTMGEPVSILGISRDPGCPPIAFAKTSGGLVLDLCVHDIDLCRWFFNSEITEVYARGAVVRYPELGEIGDIDHVNIELTFSNGKVASLEGSRNSQYGYDVRTEIVCSKGSMNVGSVQQQGLTVLDAGGTRQYSVPGFLERFYDAYRMEMQQFVLDVLKKKEAPAVTVMDGVRTLEVALAANESMRLNRPITIDQWKSEV
ncbi:Gfo/Idh/MocA family oxidoreductase [uncultured Sphaerochaeta sp.]|uniref:Gfo/Idh/MocA family protein n=1 Tax=uncultured Sphaerochaeta sp. TaxID=886478 RepID=UPI002A0A2A37|nr:Gfo/Idh/MocA family oxidoreductase [uncultured Sphaerochaeta sp.]